MNIKSELRAIGIFCLFAVLSVAVIGCGAKKKSTASPDELAMRKAMRISDAQAYDHFTNANIIEMLGANEQALREYEKAVKYNPKSVIIRTDYARLLFRLHRIGEALQQALLIEPKNSEVNLLIGDCYRLTDRNAEAMKYYRQSVEQDPDNINAYWYLAGYYQQNDKPDSAIWAYYELARLSDTYRIWLELGLMLGRDQRYSEALSAFARSLELNPEKSNINGYLGMATTYDALDSTQLAEKYIRQAEELDPLNVRIYRQELNMYRMRNDVKKSIEASEKLVALVPSDWEAQRYYGFLLYADSQLTRADSLFRSRIDFGDDHPLNYFYIGRIALERGNIPEARTDFVRCVTRDSSFVDGWLNLAFTWRESDSLDKAIDIYKQGLEYINKGEGRETLLFALATAQERAGHFQEAVTTFEDLISLNPDFDQALNYLGYMLADKGQQLKYALELIDRALKISPENGAYLDSYGWAQFKLGNYKEALAGLEKAASIIDNDPIIYEHLGDVYLKMGKKQEAKAQYQKALELDPKSLNIEEKMKE